MALLVLTLPALAQDITITPQAKALFKAGVALLEDRAGPQYRPAYDKFKAAYDDSPSTKILGNLGLCAAELERYGEAIEAYEKYLATGDVDAEERKEIEAELVVLRGNRATLALTVRPVGSIVVDQRRPAAGAPVENRYGPFEQEQVQLTVRAGVRRVTLETPDGRKKTVVLQVAPGSSKAATLAIDADKPKPVAATTDPFVFVVAYVGRPMTLPQFTVAPYLRFRLGHTAAAPDLTFGIDIINASIGLFDWLQVDAEVLPLDLQPTADYGTAFIGGTARYVDHDVVELGSGVRQGHFRAPGERHYFLELRILEALFHLGDVARIDTAFRLSFITRSPVTVGMFVPLRLAFQPAEVFYLGAATGVGIFNFDVPGDTVYFPIGAFAGATVPSDNDPLVDFELSFDFNQLLSPGAQDKFETRAYTGAFTTRVYFPL